MNTLNYVFSPRKRLAGSAHQQSQTNQRRNSPNHHFILFRFLWDSLKSFWLSLRLMFHPPRSLSSSTPSPSTSPPDTTPTTRTSTPTLSIKRSPFYQPKTLVLDLDETLIHSTTRPYPPSSPHLSSKSSPFTLLALTSTLLSLPFSSFRSSTSNKAPGQYMVEVVLGGKSTLYHVYKRPFVDFFLRTVSGWYTLVIFTASVKEYADPVIDWLDAGRGIFPQRFFRDSCTQLPNGSYTKNLTVVDPDLTRICLIDNSPISYSVNEANGIPIEGWTSDPSDEVLLDLLPVLDSLRFTSDVRHILGLRKMGGDAQVVLSDHVGYDTN